MAINASYSGGYSLTERIAVIRAAKAGILLVAAAGNSGSAYIPFPANYDTSLDAVDPDGVVVEPAAWYDGVISVAARADEHDPNAFPHGQDADRRPAERGWVMMESVGRGLPQVGVAL